MFKSYLKCSEHFTISRYSSLNPRTRIIFLKFKVTTLFSASQSSFTSRNQRDQPRKSRVCYHDCASLLLCLSLQHLSSIGTSCSTFFPIMAKPLCVFLCVCAQLLSPVPLFYNPINCSPPGSSVHGISQERTLEQAVIFFSRGSSRPRD